MRKYDQYLNVRISAEERRMLEAICQQGDYRLSTGTLVRRLIAREYQARTGRRRGA